MHLIRISYTYILYAYILYAYKITFMHLYAMKHHLHAYIRQVKSLSCIYIDTKVIYMHTYVPTTQ